MTSSNTSLEAKGALREDQNRLMNEEGFSFSGFERDALLFNLGRKKFLDISGVSGIDSISDGRAAVYADFDNDGDLDVFLTTLQGEGHLLFRNNVGQDNNFVRIQLEGGPESGGDAFGSIVRVKTSSGILTKLHAGGSGYISQHDPRLLFGLGQDKQARWIEVTWPNAKVERFHVEGQKGTSLLLREGTGRSQLLSLGSTKLPDPLTARELFQSALKIAVGQPLPDLSLKTLEGLQTPLSQWFHPDRHLLINFWATWCAPCAHEIPELEKMRPQLAARGIDLVGINVDTEVNAPIRKFWKERMAQYPTLIGGITAIESIFEGDSLTVPLSLLVEGNGMLREIIPGWSDQTRQRMSELANGQTPLSKSTE